MKPSTSLFLDSMRFIAALVVLLHHLSSRDFNATLPWIPWGHEAVVLFFAMSGFVIAYVLETRERDPRQYAAARLARLYSVVLPALLLTPVLDGIGRMASVEVYAGVSADRPVLRLLVNALYIQQSWNLTAAPLSNAPFWSLGFEFWYYAIFGSWTLLRGKARYGLTALCCLAAGPRIVAHMPVWLAGVLAFHASRNWRPTPVRARALFMLSGAAVIAMILIGSPLSGVRDALTTLAPDKFVTVPFGRLFLGDMLRLPEDLLLASAFALMIASSGDALSGVPLRGRGVAAIRYLAGSTFSLYLFHIPVLYCLVAWTGLDRHSPGGLLLVGAATLIACVGLSYLGERQVARWRALFLTLIDKARASLPLGRATVPSRE